MRGDARAAVGLAHEPNQPVFRPARIRTARAILAELVKHLRDEVCFDVIKFGNHVTPRFESCLPATRARKAAAIEWINDPGTLATVRVSFELKIGQGCALLHL